MIKCKTHSNELTAANSDGKCILCEGDCAKTIKYIAQDVSKCSNPQDNSTCQKCERNFPAHPNSERQVYCKPFFVTLLTGVFTCGSYVEIEK